MPAKIAIGNSQSLGGISPARGSASSIGRQSLRSMLDALCTTSNVEHSGTSRQRELHRLAEHGSRPGRSIVRLDSAHWNTRRSANHFEGSRRCTHHFNSVNQRCAAGAAAIANLVSCAAVGGRKIGFEPLEFRYMLSAAPPSYLQSLVASELIPMCQVPLALPDPHRVPLPAYWVPLALPVFRRVPLLARPAVPA